MADTKKKQNNNKAKGKSSTGKKNSSGSKNNAAKQRTDDRAAGNKPKYVPTENEKKLRNEIMLLAALAVMILLELSCMGMLSPLGDYIGYFIFGCFGFLGYIMPIIAFLGAAFLVSNRSSRNAVVKFSAGICLVLLACSLIHLIFSGYDSTHGAGYFYMECGRNKNGGGFFGSLISNGLCSILGIVGAYIIILLLIIVSLIIITEKSFIGGVKRGSTKIYKTARDDVEKIRASAENYTKEKNYQKNKRINKKVKGVNLAKLENPDVQNEEMHEITGKVLENASLYRGKVNFQEEDKESADEKVKSTGETVRECADGIYGNNLSASERQNVSYEEKRRHVCENNISEYGDRAHEYEENLDDEGFFKPKERIDVRESAINVMNRPMYGMGGTSGNQNKNMTAGNNTLSENVPAERKYQGSPRNKVYVLPKTTLLKRGMGNSSVNELELRETADLLKKILKNFGVSVEVTEYHKGPSVTRYEVQPEIGTRLSKITALADDIKLNMAATDIRIEPIPGKSTIGIEIPNKKRDSVLIRDLIESPELTENKSKIAFAAGMDIAGNVVVGDIAKMPHMLVAGTTGSGKSVFTNSIIQCILFRATPDEVRLIIVDPKVVEFGVYNGIPHLLQPVVTEPRLASNTLKWAVNEMSERYKKFADMNVRDLKGYNEKLKGSGEKPLPQIVIVIDELADLMMVAAKEVEESICRLAQLARAAGIHLIIATQRPSVDVVTGLIKANIPSRVALSVSSGVDSRTVIDSVGAEKLLGNGDMLFYPSGYVKPVRLQGAFVSDEEVQRVVEFWKAQAGQDDYDNGISEFVANQPSSDTAGDGGDDGDSDGNDEYFTEAVRLCIDKQKASVSMVQRNFHIGFNRAARIIEQMEAAGVVGADEGTKPRKILMTMEEFEQTMIQN